MSEEDNYYVSKRSEFFAQFEDFVQRIVGLMNHKYGENDEIIVKEIKEEYSRLYKEIPFIGGDSNPLTFNLVSAVGHLAVYKVLKRHGKPLNQIGELSYGAEEELFGNNPQLIPPMTHPKYVYYMKMAAKKSEEKKYPGDWVYKFIEGKDFDYGLDFIECGIHKFFNEHDASEFTPYLCAMDRIISENGNLGLHRTETLAEGSDRCNFRYKGGRKTQILNTVIKD
jgi:hypothetical protein